MMSVLDLNMNFNFIFSCSSGKPSAPVGPLEVVHISCEKVTLKWKAPENNGGVPLASYVVQMKKSSDPEWHTFATVDADKTKCTVDQTFEPSVQYTFRIMAKNLAGLSPALQTNKTIIVPAKSASQPDQPEGPLNVEIKSPSSLNVMWNHPKSDGGAPIEKYVVSVRKTTETIWTEMSVVDSSQTRCTLTGLAKDCDYHVCVTAQNVIGVSEGLQTDKPVSLGKQKPILLTPPPPCRGPINVKNVYAESVTLQWNKPEDDGGSPITGYVISKSEFGSNHWEEVEKVSSK